MMIPRFFAFALIAAAFAAAQTPPPTPAHPVTDTLHGVAITDPYRWLEDQNSPETRAWLDAQIQYTQTFLSRIPIREKVKQRLAQLSRIDSYGFPTERHGRYFLQPAPGEREPRLHLHAAQASTARTKCWSTRPISAKTKPPPSSSPA
jgi:protease II